MKPKFKCPYCGENMVFEQSYGTRRSIFYSRSAERRCSNCKKEVRQAINYKYRYLKWCVLFSICLVPLFFVNKLIMPLGIIAAYVLCVILYHCSHYDFFDNSERERRDNIIVEFKDTAPFRKNTKEYVCELRYSKLSNKEQTYIIFDDTYKGKQKTLKFCMVAGETPCIDDEVKIVTQNANIFVGKVVQVIPKTATAQTIIPEHPVAPSKPQKRKNWKDPDYFN